MSLRFAFPVLASQVLGLSLEFRKRRHVRGHGKFQKSQSSISSSWRQELVEEYYPGGYNSSRATTPPGWIMLSSGLVKDWYTHTTLFNISTID